MIAHSSGCEIVNKQDIIKSKNSKCLIHYLKSCTYTYLLKYVV